MNVSGHLARRRPADRRGRRRAVALLLLAAVALVPALARAHDRLDRQRTPAQQHSRFRWTNSCESVPQKISRIAIVAPVATPAAADVEPPPPARWTLPPADAPAPVSALVAAAPGLRAPPALHS
jgi:hypothetical protein